MEAEVRQADAAALRHDAAVVYKDFLSAAGPDFAVVPPGAWPKSFRAFKPVRVQVYPDGVALALTPTADSESGLYIVPQGMERPPVPHARARFRPMREGIFRYQFGRLEN